MKLSKKIFYQVASTIPATVLKKISPVTALFPYHHLVSDHDVLHVKHLYPYKNVKQFSDDLDHLLKHLRPLAAVELVDAVNRGRELPRNSFLLSFDDGFREVYDVIAPILTAKSVPAIFFLNPAFIDNRELFYRCKISLVIDKLLLSKSADSLIQECGSILGNNSTNSLQELISSIKQITNLDAEKLDKLAPLLEISFDEYLIKQKPFVTSSQVNELAQKGFSIGAHSWNHPYYPLISADEQQLQTSRSIEFIKDNFSTALNLFSFPHSDQPLQQTFFDRAFASKIPIDLFFGVQNQKDEIWNKMIHRFNAERPDMPMRKQLNGILMLSILQTVLNRGKVLRS